MKKNKKNHKKVFLKSKNSRKQRSVFLNKNEDRLNLLCFKHLELNGQEEYICIAEGTTSFLILLSGKCEIKTATGTFALGPRSNVFAGRAHALIIPSVQSYVIKTLRSTAELMLISVPEKRTSPGEPICISPSDVTKKNVGKQTYRRAVHDIINYRNSSAHILIGETFNEAGKWSSFPPHRHAKNNVPKETKYEELYFFKVVPEAGFGMIRLYGQEKEQAYTVKNNDFVNVSNGFHPVCAAPGCTLYYLWVLAGRHDTVIPYVDPVFSRAHR